MLFGCLAGFDTYLDMEVNMSERNLSDSVYPNLPIRVSEMLKIRDAATLSEDGQRCMVSPSPELKEQINSDLERLRKGFEGGVLENRLTSRVKVPPGMNDGVIYPASMFPPGTPPQLIASAAARRAPLAGTVRVIVVLVEFSDRAFGETQQHFEELFFSQGVLADGSVREYYAEVTNNIIDIQGEVVGPLMMPNTMAHYANGASGIGATPPNSRDMARDAAVAANPTVNFGIYDNDGDGFVDAFVVVHAGSGAEQTGSTGDIWSHKWVVSGGVFNADGTSIFAYLTVPEDARIGVCAHELGHLLFGQPDLYDTDDSSEGIGNWCLMGSGSWNGGGNRPAHPSAWCKADQGWVTVVNQASNASAVNIQDVKDSHTVYRLWKDGGSGSEYFLVENRQKTGYDSHLPGDGLLIWHIDDSQSDNTNETHYMVGLEQADGNAHLEAGTNRGDAGDCWPGSSGNTTFDKNSTPNSKSYAGTDTCVAVRNISAPGATMTADLIVQCGKIFLKDFKDTIKDIIKEKPEKEIWKEFKEKEFKEKEFKEKEFKEKDIFDKRNDFDKRPEKPEIDKATAFDKDFGDGKFTDNKFTDNKLTDGKLTDGKFTDNKLTDGGFNFDMQGAGAVSATSTIELAARLAILEQRLGAIEPFINKGLRPDLSESALSAESDLQLQRRQQQQTAAKAKRLMDT